MSVREAGEPVCHDQALPPSIELVIESRQRSVGNIAVGRILPERRRRHVGPFVFLDHMGPARFEPSQGFDVLPHPHIGLSTVTYLFDGSVIHRDSLGSAQEITPGAINLMSAGRGIVHSERVSPEVRAAGMALHGLQFWTALPLAHEDGEPSFEHLPADALPSWEEGGARVRLLLGEAFGRRSPANDASRAVLLDLALEPGARFAAPALEEAAVYVVDGEVEAEGCAFARGRLLVLQKGAELVVTAKRATRAVVLGGAPLDAPRFIEWNFVASTRERIERAKAAWRAQTFPKIPGDDREFIPMP